MVLIIENLCISYIVLIRVLIRICKASMYFMVSGILYLNRSL